MPSPLLKLPPGPTFILDQFLSWKFILFAASVYLVSTGTEALGLNVPVWAIVSCSILALPFVLFAHAQYRYWMDGRKAASLGAKLAPTVPMRLPGGFDLIVTWMEAFRTGYVSEYIYPHPVPRDNKILAGDPLVDWLTEGGQTVDLRTMWKSRVSPCPCIFSTFEVAQRDFRS